MAQTPSTVPEDAVPTLESGVTVLHQDSRCSTALHRIAVNALRRRDGLAYWLDARNNASTYALYDLVDHPRRLANLRIARAFTAYQYHSLVRTLADRMTSRASLIVSPVPDDLFRDDDIPEPEDRAFLDAAVTILRELASVYDIPVLLSTSGDDDLGDLVADATDREIEYEGTDQGFRFESDDFETLLYWRDEYWQTTIPYWVELFGAVDRSPVESAYDLGLVDAKV